eukprot:GHVU01153591.1.p2 GENE.GHVU01153591.1~~GHVU01153591.1.p2  ORF type:complete len:105 (+),score=1.80 GHVU01153591.1:477-791(+)
MDDSPTVVAFNRGRGASMRARGRRCDSENRHQQSSYQPSNTTVDVLYQVSMVLLSCVCFWEFCHRLLPAFDSDDGCSVYYLVDSDPIRILPPLQGMCGARFFSA